MSLSTVKPVTVIPDPKLTDVAPVKCAPAIITARLWPRAPLAGMIDVMLGGAWTTVKPFVRVAVPLGVVTETLLTPGLASGSMVILAVILVELFTVRLLTVVPGPKLTAVAPVKYVPLMITVRLCP